MSFITSTEPSGGGGLSIGQAIANGTDKNVLFEQNGLLAQDPSFFFDEGYIFANIFWAKGNEYHFGDDGNIYISNINGEMQIVSFVTVIHNQCRIIGDLNFVNKNSAINITLTGTTTTYTNANLEIPTSAIIVVTRKTLGVSVGHLAAVRTGQHTIEITSTSALDDGVVDFYFYTHTNI